MTLSYHRSAVALTMILMLIGFALPSRCRSQQLIMNGDFESGTFAGFTLADQLNPSDVANSAHFYRSAPGSATPAVNGIAFTTSANAAGGSFYAVTASDLPGAHALLQNFTVPLLTLNLNLSFQMFVNEQSGLGAIIDPSGLDYTTGGLAQPNDNQHARVDILKAGAFDLSTNVADIVANLYLGVDPLTYDISGNLLPNPYTNYAFDLTGVLIPGGSYRLRFAEVDNLSSINLGVDNIRLVATTTPEPGFFAWLMGPGSMALLMIFRSRRRIAINHK